MDANKTNRYIGIKAIDEECVATDTHTHPADFHLAVLAREYGAGKEENKDVGVVHALNHAKIIADGEITHLRWEHHQPMVGT